MNKLTPLTGTQKVLHFVAGFLLIAILARVIEGALLLFGVILGLAVMGNAIFAPLKRKDVNED